MLSRAGGLSHVASAPVVLRLRGACAARRVVVVRTMGSAGGKPADLSDGCKGAPLDPNAKLPLRGEESIMRAKARTRLHASRSLQQLVRSR